MRTTVRRPGVTFPVDDVTPATRPLPVCRGHEAVRERLGGAIESCSDYHVTVVKDVHYQPLLAAVHTAFSQHRPLVLTPDAVWLTIGQGVAHHMTIHGERLRPRFVFHRGKLDLVFTCRGWVEGSPENPWAEAFEAWAAQIRDHVGDTIYDTLVCNFSTTGTAERAASQVVMMDTFERHFHYRAVCICGIPTVTLEGATDDWRRLADKAAGLAAFDLDWWLLHLLPICEQFVRASRGDVDGDHWRDICKRRSEYGGDVINGWVAKLFPYLRTFIGGPCTRRNPIFETGEGFQSLVAPSGLSRVPFTWQNASTGRERRMEAVGGFLGVTQDPETLALRPAVGWAVRTAETLDVLLEQLSASHTTFPGARLDRQDDRGWELGTGLPPDLSAFYHRTNGAELYGEGEAAVCRIVPIGKIEPLDWGELPERYGNSRGPGGRIWHRLAWLADGSFLALNLDLNRRDPRPRKSDDWGYDPLFHAVCHVRPSTQGKPGENPVVALSFTELFERLLDGGPGRTGSSRGLRATGTPSCTRGATDTEGVVLCSVLGGWAYNRRVSCGLGERRQEGARRRTGGAGPPCRRLDARADRERATADREQPREGERLGRGVRRRRPRRRGRGVRMLVTEEYREQVKVWPRDGRHVLAQFDTDSVVVYQAYRPSIGRYAAEHGRFGGEFSFERMSWVKPNFLWMMYRSGWGTKEDQQVTLALRLRRAFFDAMLTEAVPSSWDREIYATREGWSAAVGRSAVRLQWDPDHHPSGAKLERRAI